jgi:hypothetical protein
MKKLVGLASLMALTLSSHADARSIILHSNLVDPLTLPFIDPHKERIDMVFSWVGGTIPYEVDMFGLGMPDIAPWAEYDKMYFLATAKIDSDYSWFIGTSDAIGGALTNNSGEPGSFKHYSYIVQLKNSITGSVDRIAGDDPRPFYYGPTAHFTVDAKLNNDEYSWAGGTFGTPQFDAFIGIETHSVPEPASWAMMVGGFGLIGSSLRYRRRQSASFWR